MMDALDQQVTTGCQIFSGTAFLIIVAFCVFSNSMSPFDIKREKLDKRLKGSVRLSTFVAIFSCFFNFFQLTELDNYALPRSTSYVLDMSRPFEWICTCPLMQAVLVVLAGDKVPDYRLYLMPLLSFTVLIMGIVAVSVDNDIGRQVVFSLASMVALAMFYLNRAQCLEVSDGEEGLLVGSSPFRKLSLLLIVTWFPFPIWFFLSPEGASVVTDIKVIQVGWAFLNIVAKGSFILYLQKTKTDYFNEMRMDAQAFNANGDDLTKDAKNKFADVDQVDDAKIDLNAVLEESMGFLALTAKASRLHQLLKKAKITSCSKLDALDEHACRDASLPWELIYVMKRRLQARRMGHSEDTTYVTGTLSHNSMGKVESNGHARHQNGHKNGTSNVMSFVKEKDIDALQEAIKKAEMAGAEEEHLEVGRARLQEARHWQVVKEYLGKDQDFQAKIGSSDAAGVRGAIEVAEAVGLAKLAQEGKDHLEDMTRRTSRSKASLKKGITSFKEQDWEAAIAAFTEAIEASPENAEAFLNRSAAYGRLRRWDEAEADAAQSVQLDPGNVKAHHSKALALLNLGQAQAALDACIVGLANHGSHELLLRVREKAEKQLAEDQKLQAQQQEQREEALAAEHAAIEEEAYISPRAPGTHVRVAI